METTVPDRTEPIVAWRVWGITEHGLVSVTQRQARWSPYRRMEAVCLCKGQEKPYCDRETLVRHICGIHGTTKYRDALQYYCVPDRELPYGSVLGQVNLWGRVIEHENGVYRAEFAYPASFALDSRERLVQRFLIQGLARMYGVDTKVVEFPWLTQERCECEACQKRRWDSLNVPHAPLAPRPPAVVLGPQGIIAPNPNIIIQPAPSWPQSVPPSTSGGGIGGILPPGTYIWTVGPQKGGI